MNYDPLPSLSSPILSMIIILPLVMIIILSLIMIIMIIILPLIMIIMIIISLPVPDVRHHRFCTKKITGFFGVDLKNEEQVIL